MVEENKRNDINKATEQTYASELGGFLNSRGIRL